MKLRNPLLGAVAIALFPHVGFAQEQDPDRLQELERRIEMLGLELEAMQLGGATTSETEIGQTHSGLGPAASKIYAKDSGVSVGGYGEMLFTEKIGKEGDSLDFYRAIVYFGYRFDENWVFNSEIEWEHVDETTVEFAYIDYLNSDAWNVRIGHMLMPIGITNQMHEPTTFLTPNRPLVERFVLPSTWHENGVALYGQVADFNYDVAIVNGFNSDFDLASSGLRGGRQKGSKASAEDLAYLARVNWNSMDGLVLGGSVYFGDSAQTETSASDFGTTIWELHAEYQYGPWQTQALFAQATIEDADLLATPSASDDLSGWYLQLGYDLLADNGKADSLVPYLHYSAYDLQEESATDTEVTRLMAGIAWQPIPQLVFKGALTREEEASSEDDILELSIGYIF
jgi:hypothetical protein